MYEDFEQLDYLEQCTENYEEAKDFARGLQEVLTEKWDADKAEHCLEELCYYLKVPYNAKPLIVEASNEN